MFSIFRSKENSTTPEQKFWNWFSVNKKKIESFIDSEHRDYSIYELLTKKMRNYSSQILPELTKTIDDKYVLIITPDGIKAGIEATKSLAAAMPIIDNWIVEKFRQPCNEITLNWDGLTYSFSDIEVLPEIDTEKEVVNIDVYIRNRNTDEDKYTNLALLYLDHILGEFNTLTKVGFINFHHLNDHESVEDSLNLIQLRELIAKELY